MEINTILKCPKNTESFVKKIRYETNSLKILTNSVKYHLEKINQSNIVKQNISPRRTKECHKLKVDLVEELYSQVKLFISAVIQYIDTLRHRSHLPSIISIPQYSSLPSVCSMLWTRVYEVCERRSAYTTTTIIDNINKSDEMISSGTQTVNSCIMYCESCNISMNLVRTIVNAIINEQRRYCVKKTNVSRLRDHYGIKVIETSQWGAMHKWVGAIIEDLTWAMSITAKTQEQCAKLTKTKTTSEHKHKKEMKVVQNDLAITLTQLEAEKEQVIYLNNQIEHLNNLLDRKSEQIKDSVQQMNSCMLAFKKLNDFVNNVKNNIREVNKSHKRLSEFIKSTLELEARIILDLKNNIITFLDHLHQYFTEMVNNERDKQIELNHKMKDTETTLSKLQSENVLLNQQNGNLTKQIEDLRLIANLEEKKFQVEVKKYKSKCAELEKNNGDITARELLLQSKLTLLNQPNINISGEPVKDMENQRQLNKQKIKALLKENANLKTTITKLRDMKLYGAL